MATTAESRIRCAPYVICGLKVFGSKGRSSLLRWVHDTGLAGVASLSSYKVDEPVASVQPCAAGKLFRYFGFSSERGVRTENFYFWDQITRVEKVLYKYCGR